MTDIIYSISKIIAIVAGTVIIIELVNKLSSVIKKKRLLKLTNIRDKIDTGDINIILAEIDKMQKYWRWPREAISMVRSECLYKLGKVELALAELDKVQGDLYSDALTDKGCINQDIGNYDLAIECFEKALAIEPHNPIALLHMGIILFEREHYVEAEKYLAKLVNIEEFDVAYEMLARIFQKNGQIQKAIDAMNRAVQLNSRSDYYSFLSELYEHIGDRQSASECFLKSEKLLLKESDDSMNMR